jgi:hypothetical protein
VERWCGPLLIAAAMIAPGCSALTMRGNPDKAAKALESSPEAREYEKLLQARRDNAIVLQINRDTAGGRVLPLPKNGEPVFLNDLLTQTGVGQKIGQMTLTVYRVPDRGGAPLKMQANWDANNNCVEPSTDYALRPGDRVVVENASTGLVDRVMQSIGPLGGYGTRPSDG